MSESKESLRVDGKFAATSEDPLCSEFLAQGYVIKPVEDRRALDRIAEFVANQAADHLAIGRPTDPVDFLNRISTYVTADRLNDLRLKVFEAMAATKWVRPAYFGLARRALETLVGNELAMQRRINLSIQLPNDDSSLLPVHADVWSGDSPFEVVVWVPLVDCFATKSMYLLPPRADRDFHIDLKVFRGRSSEDLYRAIESHLLWLDVPFGNFLLFSQNLMHGNRVNREADTRWTMNCRFKGLFTPYADKRLGEFFEPITIKPATRLGMTYELPGGFDE